MERLEDCRLKEIKPFFRFSELPLTNTEHLLIKQLSVGYHFPVLSKVDFRIGGGQKVVLTGFNGIGKSTLLKTLTGQIPAMGEPINFSEQVTTGYFEQDLIWRDGDETPLQIVSEAYPQMATKEVRKHLACCGISSKHAMQAIRTLSGGEQAKVKICLLTLTPCNFFNTGRTYESFGYTGKRIAKKRRFVNFQGQCCWYHMRKPFTEIGCKRSSLSGHNPHRVLKCFYKQHAKYYYIVKL